MEVELALRLKQDFDPGDSVELYQAFDAGLPRIEVVESRPSEFPCPEPLVQLADLQSHGALVMGAVIPLPALEMLDLRVLSAQLSFNCN